MYYLLLRRIARGLSFGSTIPDNALVHGGVYVMHLGAYVVVSPSTY